MDACIQLYALCRESREKRDMGFEMSAWDRKLLKYGLLFEGRIMDLSLNLRLFEALDRCWKILAECFEPAETGIRRAIVENTGRDRGRGRHFKLEPIGICNSGDSGTMVTKST